MLTETTDYERFEYKHYDETPLTLEEAVKKAQALRSGDEDSVYRVMPLDDEMTYFYVDRIAKGELYASLLSRVSEMWGRLFSLTSRRPR